MSVVSGESPRRTGSLPTFFAVGNLARGLCFTPVVVLLCGVIAACGPRDVPPDTRPRDIALLARDGARLAATLYPVSRPHPAGLILVHMLGSDRTAWASFALEAQRKGYLTIAFDMRGHGESSGPDGTATRYRSFNQAAWLGVLHDIDAAKKTLLEQGADPDNLALVGASIGANLALRYAAEHDDIQALVLLSPGIAYRGIETKDALASYGRRPLLLMATQGDTYAMASCETLRGLAKGQCELREYEGSAHGTDLFGSASTSQGQVFLWLDSIIGPGAAEANRTRAGSSPVLTPPASRTYTHVRQAKQNRFDRRRSRS